MPNCRAYDPCFASEFAVILDHGMRAMLERREDVFYYVTLMNENYPQPSLEAGSEADIVKGMHRVHRPDGVAQVRLVGSGTILREALEAAALLKADWHIDVEVWSATSFSELARDGRETARFNRLHPDVEPMRSHVATCLAGDAPIVAVSDYVRAWPQLIGEYVAASFTTLGTDGFGRSDTRAALRAFFEIDRHQIALAALTALRDRGAIDASVCNDALRRYAIDPDAEPSWLV